MADDAPFRCVCGRRLLVIYVCVYCRREDCTCVLLTDEKAPTEVPPGG